MRVVLMEVAQEDVGIEKWERHLPFRPLYRLLRDSPLRRLA